MTLLLGDMLALNVAVTGPTVAGKTTLTLPRAAIHEPDPDQRWYCIERIPELQLLNSGHRDVIEVQALNPARRPPRTPGLRARHRLRLADPNVSTRRGTRRPGGR